MPVRDHVVLLINGQRREVRGGDCFLTLAEYLRQRLGLAGTKVVCSEGDCGSCTVLVGRPGDGKIHYLPIDSCIRFLFQLDGTHVVTVEGLSHDDSLTPVQQAMVDCHGSQCGYCTPGFVMAMTAWFQRPERWSLDEHLSGNLCRCTGYVPILEAGKRAHERGGPLLDQVYSPALLLEALLPLAADALDLRGEYRGQKRRAYCPTTLQAAVEFRSQHSGAKVVAGATDVGVQWNKRAIGPNMLLDLNRIQELDVARIEKQSTGKTLIAGARATWTTLSEICKWESAAFARIIDRFGAPQIRHVGTIGGNLINASPIADSLPFLFVQEAELELVSPAGRRYVNVNDFYEGYKRVDLRSDELLASVRVPLPGTDDLLELYKIARRRDLDISTFTAAIRMRVEGDTIVDAALAYGGVAPRVVRLRETEHFLRGRPFNEVTMCRAGKIAVTEITPISDVRGSAEYRCQLARNVLLKFYNFYSREEIYGFLAEDGP